MDGNASSAMLCRVCMAGHAPHYLTRRTLLQVRCIAALANIIFMICGIDILHDCGKICTAVHFLFFYILKFMIWTWTFLMLMLSMFREYLSEFISLLCMLKVKSWKLSALSRVRSMSLFLKSQKVLVSCYRSQGVNVNVKILMFYHSQSSRLSLFQGWNSLWCPIQKIRRLSMQ